MKLTSALYLLLSAAAVSSVTSQEASSTVFVTSTRYNGNLGGLAGADAICQERAEAAGLAPGIYLAWLSVDSGSAGTPLTRFVQSPGPYTLVDGTTIVANNWADLTDGFLAASISLDENGEFSDMWPDDLFNYSYDFLTG